MASDAERELRDAVVERLRALLPASRIIHELNTAGQGSPRMDLAAVTTEKILAVELKSERDRLDRLEDQCRAFAACSHHVLIAAHRRFFVEYRAPWRQEDQPPELDFKHRFEGYRSDRPIIWCYPIPDLQLRYEHHSHRWDINPIELAERPQPQAACLLEMLWRDELAVECARHRIATNRRSTRATMIRDMVWMMTGREICRAACRRLRARKFAEADPPVVVEEEKERTLC